MGKGAKETAGSAMQVAGILDEVGHYKEAYTFASLAAETFEKVYDKNTEMIYTAKW